MSCQNCVKADEEDVPDDSPVVDVSCTGKSKFTEHIIESFQELLGGSTGGQHCQRQNATFQGNVLEYRLMRQCFCAATHEQVHCKRPPCIDMWE